MSELMTNEIKISLNYVADSYMEGIGSKHDHACVRTEYCSEV